MIGSFLEKCGKIWKNGRFSGRLRPDWGNTTRAATAGLGSKGLMQVIGKFLDTDRFWHGLDIMACIVHKVVKELDIAEC